MGGGGGEEKHTFWAVIIRHFPVTIQGNANLAFLCGFKSFSINFDGVCVCEDDIMTDT